MVLRDTRIRLLAGLAVFASLLGSPLRGEEPKPVSADHAKRMKAGLELFQKHVRPVLVQQCLKCHGGEKTRGKFDLTTRKAMLSHAMVGKDAKSSRVLGLLRHEAEPHMPSKSAKLPAETVKHIAAWLDLGAPFDKPLVDQTVSDEPSITPEQREFWSFQPLQDVTPPTVKNDKWTRTPIDRFILAPLEELEIESNAVAEPRILVRRAYFDLWGLPPTPEQIDEFVQEAKIDVHKAMASLVDRLLDSPHYGERWARHWMDVARFAESHGYEQDYDRPHAYHYRDFLIRAFNADMPYTQFVGWQLAGDELAPDKPLAMMATGFLGAGVFPTQLTEMEFESARYDELDDMTATTGVAFLGLSIGCARCHDHKFDPIPSYDYYRIASAFTKTIRSEIDLTLAAGAKPTKVMVCSEGYPHMKHHADGRGFPHFYPKTFYLNRGDVNQKKAEVQPGYLQVLMRNGKPVPTWQVEPPKNWKRTSFSRASLANWITDTEHGAGHLAARVMVNRLWQHHFGKGLVATPNDFGKQGELPTHPELLDWLARDLIQQGWTLKRMHKRIMTSAVYMQSSKSDAKRMAIDRDNLYHWKRTPRRLEAEAIRDALLHVSGLLDPTMYGKGTLDPNMKRRSVYFFIKRSKLIPFMMLFDWPEHLVSIGSRSNTTIAPQALLFLNSPQCRQYADGLAKRLGGLSTEKAIEKAYRLAFARLPRDPEKQLALAFLAQQSTAYKKDRKPNAEHLALVDLCQTLMSTNEFVYVD